MKSKVKLGVSPITNVIYSGRVNDKLTWVGDKHDVTADAVSAVARHLLVAEKMLRFEYNGENYVLKVEKYETNK